MLSSTVYSLAGSQSRRRLALRSVHRAQQTRLSTVAKAPSESVLQKIAKRPIEYATIPCVAAFVGITTNWMGVKVSSHCMLTKTESWSIRSRYTWDTNLAPNATDIGVSFPLQMLFYPIEYVGTCLYRAPDTPYGFFGWQGVVPTKTKMMAARLVKIVTERLLSLDEAFSRLDPTRLSQLLLPAVQESIQRDCGDYWYSVLNPLLPMLLTHLLGELQKEINVVVDLPYVVNNAFVRDKVVLVDLFQKVGRVELEFLVNSGFGFGFLLGLAQMGLWAAKPRPWTLPVAGALVGYVTNWIAIKLLFEPVEPVNVGNMFVLQGLFESRQVEVSDEFGAFMEERVLNSPSLLDELSNGGDDGQLHSFLRRHLPYPIPQHIISAAVKAVQEVALNPLRYPELHNYVTTTLDIENTLAVRLKRLSCADFEDLLHPVFQEDEITLIVTGGVLGLIAGAMQTRLGWGGPGATRKAIATIFGTLLASGTFYLHQKYEAQQDEPPIKSGTAEAVKPVLRRRLTIVRPVEETC